MSQNINIYIYIYIRASELTEYASDCSAGNMMMDAPSVFPKGFHPCSELRDRGGMFGLKPIPRHKAKGPIRYYIIDFGISRLYGPGDPHKVVGDEGAERDIPEMSDLRAYDPFPADVFIMGNACKRYFVRVRCLALFQHYESRLTSL